MEMIKEKISQWLNIEQGILNEIEIEDIKLEPSVENKIDIEVSRILALLNIDNKNSDLISKEGRMVCKSYWIETTKELVLYVWIGKLPKTIVVPEGSWTLRDDITYH